MSANLLRGQNLDVALVLVEDKLPTSLIVHGQLYSPLDDNDRPVYGLLV